MRRADAPVYEAPAQDDPSGYLTFELFFNGAELRLPVGSDEAFVVESVLAVLHHLFAKMRPIARANSFSCLFMTISCAEDGA